MSVVLSQTKFNHTTSTTVLEALRNGLSIRAAAALAGVTHTTVRNWIKEYDAFGSACEQAKAEYIEGLAKVVKQAAETDPRLAAKILEAKDPEGWAPRTVHQGDPDAEPIRHEVKIVWPSGPLPPAERG